MITINGESYSRFVGCLCGINMGGVITNCCINGNIIVGDVSNSIGGLCGLNHSGKVDGCSAFGEIEGGVNVEKFGGLCGYNRGTLSSCFAKGTLMNSENSMFFGGLCGYNEAGITLCYAIGDIVCGDGAAYIGGLSGQNCATGRIYDCYAMGNIYGGDSTFIGGLCGNNDNAIRRCYASCTVIVPSPSNYIGGLCGGMFGATVVDGSFWDVQSSGLTTSVKGLGKTTVEMKTLAIFTGAGWDFVGESANGTADVWRMCGDGVDYPRLSWEFSRGGDMDCPDAVALEDLLYLAGRWKAGTAATVGAADGNGDGKVDLQDFGILADKWMK